MVFFLVTVEKSVYRTNLEAQLQCARNSVGVGPVSGATRPTKKPRDSVREVIPIARRDDPRDPLAPRDFVPPLFGANQVDRRT